MANRGDWHKEVIVACPSEGWAYVCEYVPPPHSTTAATSAATRLLGWIRLICGQWKQAAPIAVLCSLLILNLRNDTLRTCRRQRARKQTNRSKIRLTPS